MPTHSPKRRTPPVVSAKLSDDEHEVEVDDDDVDDEPEPEEDAPPIDPEQPRDDVGLRLHNAYDGTLANQRVVTQIVSGFKRSAKQRRIPSQIDASGGVSPTVAAAFVDWPADRSYEWLHCSGWLFGEIDSVDGSSKETPQQARNLVLGTCHSNQQMIPYEVSLQWLANDCNGVQFTLEATPNRDGKMPYIAAVGASTIAWKVTHNHNDHPFEKAFATNLDHHDRVELKVARAEIFTALFPDGSGLDGCTLDGQPRKKRKPKRIGSSTTKKRKC